MDISKEMSQAEHIRYRAGMYIGRLGNGIYPNDGIYTLLQEALHYVVNEFCEGHGKRIEVQIEDKQTIVIRDYGRGMSFEERYAESCHSSKMMVDMLTCVGMDAVNALSSCMDIRIYRKGTVTECHYEEGILLGEWTEKTNRKDGISISFTPDENIFGPFQFQEDIVFALLRNISYLNVGLEIVYDRIRMKSTEGMAELLADKMRNKGEHPKIGDVMHESMAEAKRLRQFARKCLSMSIGELVDLWNDGIDSGDLDSCSLNAIRDAFLAKKVQVDEMQQSGAIGKRLKIGYDKVFNIIHCSGRFFSETDGVLLPF